MALTDTEYSTSSFDVVAVLDKDLVQVFPFARPIKATVREDAKLMEHPLETGASVVDHRIFLPTEIELSMLLTSEEYADVYQQIKQIWKRGDILSVQSRTDSYDSMVISAIPHEESADMLDGVTQAVMLKEVKFVDITFTERKIPVNSAPKNTKTKDRGEQRPQETPEPKKSSFLSKLGIIK